MSDKKASGPLKGIRVLEFVGIGPAPFCAMLLSDMGADVVRIHRPVHETGRPDGVETRGRRSITLDLKNDEDDAYIGEALTAKADILIEGFRPGVMERLGLGPDVALKINPDLVYGRMTGWGQNGPLANKAGHDLNYLALSGALHALGTKEKPAVPLNLIADFGGGALYLAMGILAALHHARATGEGQVVDCAMTEGVTSLMAMIYGDFAQGLWKDQRESNVIDGAAPFYNVYQCADGKWLSVAAIEPPFYTALVKALNQEDDLFDEQWNWSKWPAMIDRFQDVFVERSRDDWCEQFAELDACVTPVLSLEEAPLHPQHQERQAFVMHDDVMQPAPSPRFSATPGSIQGSGDVGHLEILREWSLGPK